LARGGRPWGKAGGRARAGRRRPGAAVRHALPGVPMRMAHGRDTGLWELMRTDSHKAGAPFRLSATMAVAASVSRDLTHAGLRRIAGAPGEATGWACGAPGRGTAAIADKAYPTRRNVEWCVENGANPVIPVMTSAPGRPRGAPWRNRHMVPSLAPKGMRRRFMRGGDVQSLPREDLAVAQAAWLERKRYSRRQAAGGAIGASRQVFKGDTMAKLPDNAAAEPARKVTVYNVACR